MNGHEYKELIYLLDSYYEKNPILIYWENGLKVKCESFTGMYETDTDPGEEDYIGEYAAAVNQVEILQKGNDETVEIFNGSIEISLKNLPEKITLEDGTILWQKK